MRTLLFRHTRSRVPVREKRVEEELELRSSVVIRKITHGNQSDEGAEAHAVLMSIRETCNLRHENFDYAIHYLSQPTSER